MCPRDLRENFIVNSGKSRATALLFALKIHLSMALHLSLIKLAGGRDFYKENKSFATNWSVQSVVGAALFDSTNQSA